MSQLVIAWPTQTQVYFISLGIVFIISSVSSRGTGSEKNNMKDILSYEMVFYKCCIGVLDEPKLLID